MIENLRHADPAPETDCRRTVLTDASSKIEKPHRYRSDRRKRYEILRRLKSLDKLKSSFAAGDHRPCFKRNRTENGKLFSNKKSDEEDEECPDKKTAVMNLTLQEPCNVGARDPNYSKYDVRCRSHGSISVIGRRREMEDTVAVELGFLEKGSKAYDFFGVYDGHGGSVVARACRDRLHRLLAEIAGREEDDDDKDCCEGSIVNWKKVMVEGFKKIDEEVNGGYMAEVATMGSTAVVAVVGEEELVVANCGDSRAVLSRGGVTVPLSDDHKPDRSDELERIELSGGKVINWNGQRVLGVLATSRSIGDRYLKPYIIPDPEVIVSKRSSGDEFLILASDGLWDVISNDVACQVVRKCLDAQIKRADDEEKLSNGRKKSVENGSRRGSPAAIAARVLTKLAIARGSRDNISVIVVELRRC